MSTIEGPHVALAMLTPACKECRMTTCEGRVNRLIDRIDEAEGRLAAAIARISPGTAKP